MGLRLTLIPVLLLAAAIRFVVYLEIKDSPIIYLDHWSEADMSFYRKWARDIRSGDILTEREMRPYHSWHDRIARAVHDHSGSPESFDENVGRRMWRQWLGDKTFYEDPLYAYLLAALYSAFGEDFRVVWLMQSLLGLFIIGLVVVLAHMLFDGTIALVAGIIAALFGPLMFYEALLLRPVSNAFSGLLALVVAVLALKRQHRGLWLLSGLSFGVAFLAQSTVLVFAACIAVIEAVRSRAEPSRLATSLVPYALGFLLGVSPLLARNVAVGISPLQPAANGVTTFINENAVDSPPAGGFFISTYAPDILSRSGGRLLPAVVAAIGTHSGLGSWLVLCARKVLAFWSWYEIPNNESYYYWCLFAHHVCAVALTFAIIGPLGAVGLMMAFRRGGVGYAATVAYIASGMLISALFLTLSRLRLPYACALIPFAAFTVVSIARWLRAGLLLRVVAALAAVAAVSAVLLRPLPRGHSAILSAAYGTGNDIVWNLAKQKAAAGDPSGALRIIENQLDETEPEELRRLEPGKTPSEIPPIAAEIAGSFASLHELAGRVEATRRNFDRAEHHLRSAKLLRIVASHWERALQAGTWQE